MSAAKTKSPRASIQTTSAQVGMALREMLEDARPGRVQLLLAQDVRECLSTLSAAGESLEGNTRVIARIWESLPYHGALLDEMLDGLARLAMTLWPAWYTPASTDATEAPSLLVNELLHRARRTGARRKVSAVWLEEAVDHCLHNRLPRARELSAALEAEQLSLALAPTRCVLVLAVTGSEQSAAALLGLARVAEWMATETQASVLVVVRQELADAPELESIAFGRIEVQPTDPPPHADSDWQDTTSPKRTSKSSDEGMDWLVTPLIGRPHPNSKGEQCLWEAISNDPDLRTLFRCNQRVHAFEATTYLVDLLWRDGKLVVEVDGYYWHSSREAFSRDRERDFQLTVSGYLVLRLPHDDVVADIESAVNRVRAFVNFRRNGR